MNRCQVSEAIAKHCNQPEEAECKRCGSTMTGCEFTLVCDDQYDKGCTFTIYAPDEDDE